LTFNRGAQIAGNNYEHINGNQGTISFWFKPSWNGNDGIRHSFYSTGDGITRIWVWKSDTVSGNGMSMYVSDGNNISWAKDTSTTITSGNWYHVVGRWSNNKVDGTNYSDIRINNGSPVVSSTIYNGFQPWARSAIGTYSDGVTNSAQALIDDFAIFDRVLSTTEIAAIYGNGTSTMTEAGYVADSSLKFYANMDGSGTLQPVTYNGGAAVNDRAYNSSTNVNGDLMTNGNMEAATTGSPTSWTAVSAPTLADAEAANILQDTRSQKITVTGSAQGIKQALTVTAASNWSIEGWLKSDGTNTAQIRIRDATNGTDLATLPVTASTWTKVNAAFKAPAGCTSIEIYVESGTAASYSFYTDNVSVHKNLVNNGGMETVGANPPVISGWSDTLNTGAITQTSTAGEVHSGTYAVKITPSAFTRTGIITAEPGNSYLLNFWARGDGTNAGSYYVYDVSNGAAITSVTSTGVAGTTYQKVSKIFKAPSGCTQLYVRFYGPAAGITYYDDVSVTPLDNVAMSLKAWAPVSDSSAVASSLSVQGDSDGVQSLAAGVRNGAYTFDGSTGYLRQQTIATNIGTLSYVGNDTTTASFTDDAATMSTYQGSAPYPYMIVVTNSDNTTSWGYMGAASSGNITIFTTKGGTTRGWNGTAPVAGSKVPVGYEIRKTDFQITGAFTVGVWIKGNDPSGSLIGKRGSSTDLSYGLGVASSKANFQIGNSAGTGWTANIYNQGTDVTDNNWHYLVGVNTGTNTYLYLDGSQIGSGTGSTTIFDTSVPLMLSNDNSTNFSSYSIDEPFVTAEALTAGQIFDMYNNGR
ncbi:MAG: LamG-like jellyroll fold domain-containing protein, partial [Candidatus Roizmanbacteria bacterium]